MRLHLSLENVAGTLHINDNVARRFPHLFQQEATVYLLIMNNVDKLTANAKVATVLDSILASPTRWNLRGGR
jgi:hypothetical protein